MSNAAYTPVIGLEIHVQLATKSKMFGRESADWFGKPPNSVVGPVALGLPGALPVPNKQAIQWAILIGKALNCKINRISKFDRKHYFYPDLPKGYQISQYDQPFSYDGFYEFISKASEELKKVRITRVHLEEDTGKLIHKGSDTLVDFNRAGVPLVEIVTEPDFDNSDDVKQFLEELQVLVRYLGVSDVDMEKGSMRLEPNISVRQPGEKGLPAYKVEVKNINSFKFAKNAIDFEVKRHIKLLQDGSVPPQETRGYNESKGSTVSQRIKEEAADYRYFPDPDIPPFVLDDAFLADIDALMPELPHNRMKRFVDMGIKESDAYILTRDKNTSDFFEQLVAMLKKRKLQELKKDMHLESEIARLIVQKTITEDQNIDEAAQKIITMLTPVETDNDHLDQAVNSVIEDNANSVNEYLSGKENVIMFLVGQVMRKMQGKADAQLVRTALENRLKNRL